MESEEHKPGNVGRALKRLSRLVFLRVWRTHGGGLYGVGYVVTFVVLELGLFIDEARQSDGVLDFLGGLVTDFLLRFLFESFGNVIQAFLWPLLLISEFGPAVGGVSLVLAYLAFEYVLRPYVEERFPELTKQDEAENEKNE